MNEVPIANTPTTEPSSLQPIRVPESFDAFYKREFRRMVYLAHSTSGSSLAAEDLTQEAFIAAYKQWDTIARLDKPGAWVRRVVLNRSASAFHRRRCELKALSRLRPVRGDLPDPLSGETDEFWAQVRSLPRRQAQAIALRYLDQLSVRETAEVMQCSEGSVKTHLHRARAALAHRFGDDLGETL